MLATSGSILAVLTIIESLKPEALGVWHLGLAQLRGSIMYREGKLLLAGKLLYMHHGRHQRQHCSGACGHGPAEA